jgi:hypothetical protein
MQAASQSTGLNREQAEALVTDIAAFYDDPLGFVKYVFPWGEGSLKDELGPDEWQKDILNTLRAEILKRDNGDVAAAIQIAVASGHGIGKSCLIAWVILWFMSTRPNPGIVVTANTETQLTTKTWRELAKWHKLAVNENWFVWTATKFYMSDRPKTWFASAIPWTEHRSEAFAGLHEEHVLVIYDEASTIANIIWEVTEGAMTTPGAMWIAFGNPTQNTGRFRECFGRLKHRWITRQIDSRTAKKASAQQIQQWKEDYGEDSDFFRVRVRGVFPRSGSNQFIGSDVVERCKTYKATGYQNFPVVIGLDVARFGDDQTVFLARQGRKILAIKKYRGIDTMQTASRMVEFSQQYAKPTIFVDGVGVGGGVVDRLRQLSMSVIEVNAGETATDDTRYRNRRAEMWDIMREWLKSGAEIGSDLDLEQELTGIEYGFSPTGQIIMEKKSDMKKRAYLRHARKR